MDRNQDEFSMEGQASTDMDRDVDLEMQEGESEEDFENFEPAQPTLRERLLETLRSTPLIWYVAGMVDGAIVLAVVYLFMR